MQNARLYQLVNGRAGNRGVYEQSRLLTISCSNVWAFIGDNMRMRGRTAARWYAQAGALLRGVEPLLRDMAYRYLS